jgi:hypothetical protein
MKTIIGEYETLAAAQRAVRSLESEMSIQTIVIADQSHSLRVERDPGRDRSLASSSSAPFLVSMFGKAADIERARTLLSAKAAR